MAKIERVKITFEHEDGRKILLDIENNPENQETIIKTDFGEGGVDPHETGIHGELFLRFMQAIEPDAVKKKA